MTPSHKPEGRWEEHNLVRAGCAKFFAAALIGSQNPFFCSQ
jgi:hypothetical protein